MNATPARVSATVAGVPPGEDFFATRAILRAASGAAQPPRRGHGGQFRPLGVAGEVDGGQRRELAQSTSRARAERTSRRSRSVVVARLEQSWRSDRSSTIATATR